MQQHHEIPRLDKNGLRKFGLTTAAIIATLFGALIPLIMQHSISPIPWVIAGSLLLWALLAPVTLNPVYKIWMKIGLLLGWVNTRIILGFVFYLIITPVGLFLRLIGKNPLNKPMESTESFRITSKEKSKTHMEKPY